LVNMERENELWPFTVALSQKGTKKRNSMLGPARASFGGRADIVFYCDSRDKRDSWITALNYALRNVRELGTVSRPKGDLARDNVLAARLQDEVDSLIDTKIGLKTEIIALQMKYDQLVEDSRSIGGFSGFRSKNTSLQALEEARLLSEAQEAATMDEEKATKEKQKLQEDVTHYEDEMEEMQLSKRELQDEVTEKIKALEATNKMIENLFGSVEQIKDDDETGLKMKVMRAQRQAELDEVHDRLEVVTESINHAMENLNEMNSTLKEKEQDVSQKHAKTAELSAKRKGKKEDGCLIS